MNIKQIYWVFCKLNFLQFYITCIFIAHRIRHICSCEKIITKKQRKMEKQKKIHKNSDWQLTASSILHIQSIMLFLYALILIYRDVSPMSRSSPSSSVYSDSARSSPTPPSTDLIAELKKAAVAPTLKKTKKPSEEGKMNFIYSFGGPVKTGAVSNGATNHNSHGTADKVRIQFFLVKCMIHRLYLD